MTYINSLTRKKKFYTYYNLVFFVMLFFVFGLWFAHGKLFVDSGDGLTQHFEALVYYSRYLRYFFRELIFNQNFDFRTYSFSLGYGSDIPQTLHYYVIGDPFTLPSVIVPIKYIGLYYQTMIFVRIYLVGVSFSLFCFYIEKITKKKYSISAIMVGTIVYTFSGYILIAGTTNPYFINPLINLPLLLIGAEKIINNEKSYLYVFMVFVSCISNFYFFYMIAIFTGLYVLFRLLTKHGLKNLRDIRRDLLKLILGALLGTSMGAFIFIPVITAFMNDARRTSNYVYDFLFNINDYERNLGVFLTPTYEHHWTVMGYASICLIAVFLLFLQKNNKLLKFFFIIMTIMLLIPFFGRAMNGFSYVSNRFVWGYSFLIAYITTAKWDDLFQLNNKEYRKLIGLIIGYFSICLYIDSTRSFYVFIPLLIALLSIMIIFLLIKHLGIKMAKMAIFTLILMNISCNSTLLFAGRFYDYTNGYIYANSINWYINDTEANAIKTLSRGDDNFFRYSGQVTENNTLYSGLNSTQYYWSLANSNITNFRKELCITENNIPYRYRGVESRTFLSTLANVKYYVRDLNVPYNYEKIEKDQYGDSTSTDFEVWRNKTFLPFGYTYDMCMSEKDFDKLLPAEKQEAMMQRCIINAPQKASPKSNISYLNHKVPFTVKPYAGINYKNGIIKVKKENAKIDIFFQGEDNSESYLFFRGLKFSGYSPKELYSTKQLNALSQNERKKLESDEKYWVEPEVVDIYIKDNDTSLTGNDRFIRYHTPKYRWYSNQHDFMFNLCYSTEAKSSITLTFPTVGEYRFDSLEMLCQPMDNYEKYVSERSEDILKNVDFHENGVFATNEVTGNITLNKPKYLLLTIPYSDSWTAYVDGKEHKLFRANRMFMALHLDKGMHSIKLVYHTKGLKIGVYISIVSILIFIASIVLSYYKSLVSNRIKGDRNVFTVNNNTQL